MTYLVAGPIHDFNLNGCYVCPFDCTTEFLKHVGTLEVLYCIVCTSVKKIDTITGVYLKGS